VSYHVVTCHTCDREWVFGHYHRAVSRQARHCAESPACTGVEVGRRRRVGDEQPDIERWLR
jgi:hypothetical protein